MRGFFCLEDLEVGLCNDEDSLSAYEDCHSDDVGGLSDDGFKESYDYYKLLLTFYSFSNKNSNGI